MAEHSAAAFLTPTLVLLGAAVVAVPLFRRINLGSVVGYLVAGILIGPQIFGLFRDPAAILTIAELGIVMFLFIIGLELKPSRVWSMRKDIFGLGGAQVVLTGLVVMWVPFAFGRDLSASLIAGLGLAISSTAVMMQVLEERGEVHSPHGERAFAVAIFQDLAVIPLLLLVTLLSPLPAQAGEAWWLAAAKAIGAVGAVVLAGLYLLNPLFRFLATWGAREIMVAAALLVVVGAAALMDYAGLSMAMGAFLAGVFLAESNFRHQLEADIEPFRGILMGLFFMSVGMTIDLSVVAAAWWRIAIALVLLLSLKTVVMYGIMRLFGHDHPQAVRVGLLLAQSGEFGFVLYAAAQSAGILTGQHSSILVALVVLSMAINPFLYKLGEWMLERGKAKADEPDEDYSDVRGEVLVIGFGRFGQVTSQMLLAERAEVTIIDNDVEMIQAAATFGFRIYYGDGTRLDVLRAAGAGRARLICVCVDKREAADKIVELIKSEFPFAKLYVRSYDRAHTIALRKAGVDFETRELFESALVFGREALVELGIDQTRAEDVMVDLRKRDAKRLILQQQEGPAAGSHLMHPQFMPAPLTEPVRRATPLNAEAEDVLSDETRFSG
ncbi:potassium transporter [Phreatobacter aquaticus]|uniref:Potassium transporter n=1 Tax=Phreatobacter aquaticus TaxID=2570229 RepID=A0A4D7QDB5_9HYPH|nr:monovalent cation:proton antiporter-2 (CPA2) family protein [Phreatobacter aquaticus]QCK86000.1 potassium transporter [Phreatobacter aquaticus]